MDLSSTNFEKTSSLLLVLLAEYFMNLNAMEILNQALKQPRRQLRKLDDYMELFIVGLVLESPGLYLREV